MKSYFLIAKFGKREHLEQLLNGEIFFNNIQYFRDDGTDFRGDSMEGRIPIDPTKIQIFDKNGKGILESVPYPTSVIESFLNDNDLLMFCAATITKDILEYQGNNTYCFKDEFKSAIREFGDYALLTNTSDLLDHIRAVTDESGQKIACDSGRIIYRDLSDFSDYSQYNTTGSPLDRYFVKSIEYKNQNEWRLIIDGEERKITPNCGKGFVLKTKPLERATIMKTEELLNSEICL